MEITIYAAKRTSKEGKIFYNYLSRLTRKDGMEIPVRVKFREECVHPRPETCPCNIVFEQKDGNLVKSNVTIKDTGEVKETYTLWLNNCKPGSEFIDHSLDDFF